MTDSSSETEIRVCRNRTPAEIHANAIRLLRHYRGRFYWRRDKANRVVDFFQKQIVHVEGHLGGQLVKLEPWQRRLIRRAFGWYCHANPDLDIKEGQRKYRIVFDFVPRKNGKSVIGSGVGIYLLSADGEQGGRIVSAAADTDQAQQIFGVSKQMVLKNPRLSERIKPFRSSLVHHRSGSNYQILSSTSETKHGKNLSGVIFDELHAQPDRDLYDVLHTSIGARLNPMEWIFTTAGHDKLSVCYEQYKYALDVAEYIRSGCNPAYGIADDHLLPCLYYADPDDDWKLEETWEKANPNLGVSITRFYIRSEFKKALATPAYENTFKRLHLNQWTEQETKWVPVEEWDACKKKLNLEELKGRECFLGLDVSSKIDLSALVAVFPFREEKGNIERVVVLRWIFCPKDTASRRQKEDKVPYVSWIQQGHLIATGRDAVDHTAIRSTIHEIAKIYQVVEIGADPWNAHQLLQDLLSDGFKVIEIPQTFKGVSDATKELEVLVRGGRLEHDGCPVMRFCFKNIAIDQDGPGNIKLNKDKSGEKIDGQVALVNALARYLVRPDVGKSVYETRGLLTT